MACSGTDSPTSRCPPEDLESRTVLNWKRFCYPLHMEHTKLGTFSFCLADTLEVDCELRNRRSTLINDLHHHIPDSSNSFDQRSIFIIYLLSYTEIRPMIGGLDALRLGMNFRSPHFRMR